MKRKWTKEEEQYLIDNYKIIDFKEIQRELRRSKSSIMKKAERLDLQTHSINSWTNDEIVYLKNNYEHEKISDIAKTLGRSYQSIYIKANRLGLKRKERDTENVKKYSVNKDYFKIIDSPNKAYFLGWAVTDGNIVCDEEKHQYQFRLRIKNVDIDILEKLLVDTESTTKIYCRGDYAEVNICDREFVRNLLQYGFSNNKTYTIKFPNINESYYFDFIKGCFDGDGCYIFTDKTKKISFVSASNDLINRIMNILNLNGIKTYLCKRDTYSTIEISSKKSVYKLLNILLNTKSDFLNRKYNKMKSLYEYVS